MKLLPTIVACTHSDHGGMYPGVPSLADGSYPFDLRLIYADLIAMVVIGHDLVEDGALPTRWRLDRFEEGLAELD